MNTRLARVRDFAVELRRRHVFRAAAFYAAAAFVALQLADIIFPALNIPDSATRLVLAIAILGFPLALVLAWVYERGSDGTLIVTEKKSEARELSPNLIAVVPFLVHGNRELGYLSEGIVDLLTSKLRCAGELRCVDPHALLSLQTRAADKTLDLGRARTLARQLEAGLFVFGNVVEAGGRLHIDASMYRTGQEPGLVTRSSVEGPTSQLFEIMDDLARELLADLATGPAARLARLAATTTSSFPALKEYLMGESQMRAMRRAPAAESYQRAVEKDPTFALAWYRLGVAALWSGQLELARDATEQAVSHGERLLPHNRQLLEAFRAFLTGDAPEAERLYRVIVGRQPEDVEAWYQLSEVLFHYGPRCGGSIVGSRWAWERVIALEPDHVSALCHLAVIAASEDRHDEVQALVDRALEISPQGDAATWMVALRAWELDDRAAQQEALERLSKASDFAATRATWYVALPARRLEGPLELARALTAPTRSEEVRALGHTWLAHLELARGRWAAARERLSRVEALHPASAIAYRASMSLSPFLDLSTNQLADLRESVTAWNPHGVARAITPGGYFSVHDNLYPQLRTYLLGVLAAQLGDEDDARRRADELNGLGGRPEAVELAHDQARSVEAQVALRAGRRSEAIEALESARLGGLFELTIASPFFSQAYERFLHAELLEAEGRYPEALRWYSGFAEHSIYDLIFQAPSHLRRAEIYERLGEMEPATHHYRQFIELWRECDPELRPRVEAAEKRLADIGEVAPKGTASPEPSAR